MKIGIYNPYVDSFGGGERYVFTLAAHWSKNHEVHIFWDDESIISEAQKRFDVDLSSAHVTPDIFHTHNLIKKLSATSQYDCIFFLSDGSVPMSLAKRNILHFQVPFRSVSFPMWKAIKYQCIVCNSEFTKTHLDPSISIPRSVIYPPVDTVRMKAGIKTKTILSVGRFSSQYGAKKQNILIEAYRRAYMNKQLPDYEMVMAGGLLDSDQKYFTKLNEQAKGLPISFYPNCSFSTLLSLYNKASIYWHAAGFGESEPEQMEHFGITTVEAMASGCVPVVFEGGGQMEVVDDGRSGLLWKTPDELIQKTISVLKDKNILLQIQKEAMKTAEKFSKEKFTRSFDVLLTQL